MGPQEWVKIATDIETNYLMYDGFGELNIVAQS